MFFPPHPLFQYIYSLFYSLYSVYIRARERIMRAVARQILLKQNHLYKPFGLGSSTLGKSKFSKSSTLRLAASIGSQLLRI